jgi:hypothetical protein
LVGSWRVGNISGKRIQELEITVPVLIFSWITPVPAAPLLVASVLCHPDVYEAQDPVSVIPVLVVPESVVPVFVVPLPPCQMRSGEFCSIAPVSAVPPVELLFCDPVELVPVLVVPLPCHPELSEAQDPLSVTPVLVSTGGISTQLSSTGLREITILSFCVAE